MQDKTKFNVGDKVVIRFQYPFYSENFKEGNVGEVIDVITKWQRPYYYVKVNNERESFFEEYLEFVDK